MGSWHQRGGGTSVQHSALGCGHPKAVSLVWCSVPTPCVLIFNRWDCQLPSGIIACLQDGTHFSHLNSMFSLLIEVSLYLNVTILLHLSSSLSENLLLQMMLGVIMSVEGDGFMDMDEAVCLLLRSIYRIFLASSLAEFLRPWRNLCFCIFVFVL